MLDEEEEEEEPQYNRGRGSNQPHKPPRAQRDPSLSGNRKMVNVDEQVVGGHGMYPNAIVDYSGGSSSNNGKKIAHEEDFDHESPMQKSKNRNNYDDYDDEYYEDGQGGGLDTRPIKPKQRELYDDLDPEIDGEEAAAKQQLDQPEQQFPPGQHPFEGLDNMFDLPPPEQFNAKARYSIFSLPIYS